MKKIVIFIICMLFLLTSVVGYSLEMNTKLMGKTIVIDVGHGGVDGGSSVNGYYEKNINLDISLKLRDELIKQGVNVMMTRDGDYDLSEPNATRRKKSDFDARIKYINESGADMYLSIHMNYLEEEKYYGGQVFYTEGNEILANTLQNVFRQDLNSPLKEKKIANSIYMYKQLEIPGVLIECGFLSNNKERRLLLSEEYQEKVVATIIKGLLEYY